MKKHMKDDLFTCLGCISCVAILAACLGLAYLIFDAVMSSQLPDWVKWIILR